MACENFEQFLRLASERIPGKRLRERIRKELGDHMEDMLADKIEAGTDEGEAKKQVLSEMGDPAVLRKAFIRAHRLEIELTKLRFACTLWLVMFCLFDLIPPVLDEAKAYYLSAPVEQTEQALSARYAENEPLCFLGETDYGGRIYRLYITPADENGRSNAYYMASLRFFGKNYPDRFASAVPLGAAESDLKILNLTLTETLDTGFQDFAPWRKSPQELGLPHSEVFVFTRPTKAVFLRPLFRPVSAPEASDREMAGDDILIPETPCFIRVDAPQGMQPAGFQLLDEQKNEIQP